MSDKDENADLDEALESSLKNDEQVEESTVQPEGEAPEAEAGTVEGQEQPVEIPDELQPVSAWKEEARQAWESFAANEEYHDYLRALKNQFDGDYQYRTQLEQERKELSQRAQYADQFNQIAQQYSDVLQGRNPMDVASQLFYYSQQLAKDPKNTLQRLAKDYGVDLNQVAQDQPYVDEYTQQLEGRLNQIQQQIQQQDYQRRYEQVEAAKQQARAFEFETDAEGRPLRPYVNEVAEDMLRLMQAGYATDFQSAYDKACRMNDDVWQKIQQEQGKKQGQQRQAQAQKAKAAASAQPKPGKSTKGQPKGVEDLDDALDKVFAEASA